MHPKKYAKGPNDCNSCLLRDHQTGRLASFQASLALADHKAHGYLYKASVLCVDRGTGGRIVIDAPLQTARALAEGKPQMPESDRDSSAIDGFAVRRLTGPMVESGSI